MLHLPILKCAFKYSPPCFMSFTGVSNPGHLLSFIFPSASCSSGLVRESSWISFLSRHFFSISFLSKFHHLVDLWNALFIFSVSYQKTLLHTHFHHYVIPVIALCISCAIFSVHTVFVLFALSFLLGMLWVLSRFLSLLFSTLFLHHFFLFNIVSGVLCPSHFLIFFLTPLDFLIIVHLYFTLFTQQILLYIELDFDNFQYIQYLFYFISLLIFLFQNLEELHDTLDTLEVLVYEAGLSSMTLDKFSELSDDEKIMQLMSTVSIT